MTSFLRQNVTCLHKHNVDASSTDMVKEDYPLMSRNRIIQEKDVNEGICSALKIFRDNGENGKTSLPSEMSQLNAIQPVFCKTCKRVLENMDR